MGRRFFASVRAHRAIRTCRCGATAIEYALIAGGVALVIVAGVQLVGTSVTAVFTSVAAGF